MKRTADMTSNADMTSTAWHARLKILAETLRPNFTVQVGATMNAACDYSLKAATESWMGKLTGTSFPGRRGGSAQGLPF
jgi:hypothetical protein